MSGLGICAERCATDHAVLHSNKKIQKIVLAMSGDRQGQPKPYGPCLQHIHDFAKNAKQKVIMSQAKKSRIVRDSIEVKSLAELLPLPYEK